MTAPATVAPTGRGSRRGLLWLVLVGLAVAVAVLGGRPPSESSAPLDPRSSAPEGARALRLLLESFGAEVEVTDEVDDSEVVFVIADVLTEAQRELVEEEVADGARLVVADPYSPLLDLESEPIIDPLAMTGLGPVAPEVCTIDALEAVGPIEPGGGQRFAVPAISEGGDPPGQCFGPEGSGFVVAAERGEGTVVALGGPSPFTNGELGRADNSVLAVSLLAPQSGTRVTWLERDTSAEPVADSMWSLVRPGTRAALLQLAIAAVVYVAFRARRLGRPVREVQPTQIAGSELVNAVGHLLRQTGSPDRAARLLRADLRRTLGERLGLPRDTAPEVIAEVTAERCGLERGKVLSVVSETPVPTDDQLVALVAEIEEVRRAVIHGVAAESGGE